MQQSIGLMIVAPAMVGLVLALVANGCGLKRVGGIVFWRAGRIGGSFYISRRAVAPAVFEGR
jgi:hypothetical protein